MLSLSFLETFLRSFSAEIVTEYFLLLTVGLFVIAVFFQIIRKGKKFTENMPTILTSIGILGTFLGISIGLINFDTKNIDSSISTLLAGMKTAFFTSLFGMSCSILLKIIQSFFNASENSSVDEDDPLKIMAQQSESLQALVSQIKLLRTDINDNARNSFHIQEELAKNNEARFQEFSNKLWIKLQDFMDVLSKSATETIIDALRQVIVDFNNKLTEQFGENFKELNNAVKELVAWQHNYKFQIEQMTEQYKLCVNSLTKTEYSVKSISENTHSIPEHMDKFVKIMEIAEIQMHELEKHLISFATIRNKAVEALPMIQSYLDAIHDQMEKTMDTISTSVDTATSHYNILLQNSDKSVQQYLDNTKQMVDKYISGSNEISKTLTEENKNLIENSKIMIDNFASGSDNIAKTFEEKNKALIENSKLMIDNFTSGSDRISKTLTEENKNLIENSKIMIDKFMLGSNELSKTLLGANKNLVKETSNVQIAMSQNIIEIQKNLEKVLTDFASANSQHMSNLFAQMDNGLKDQVEKTGKAVETQLGLIDQSMNQELERVMNSFGQALVSIVHQFTNDYQKMVTEMQTIISAHRK